MTFLKNKLNASSHLHNICRLMTLAGIEQFPGWNMLCVDYFVFQTCGNDFVLFWILRMAFFSRITPMRRHHLRTPSVLMTFATTDASVVCIWGSFITGNKTKFPLIKQLIFLSLVTIVFQHQSIAQMWLCNSQNKRKCDQILSVIWHVIASTTTALCLDWDELFLKQWPFHTSGCHLIYISNICYLWMPKSRNIYQHLWQRKQHWSDIEHNIAVLWLKKWHPTDVLWLGYAKNVKQSTIYHNMVISFQHCSVDWVKI